jgi:hypothetical protein
MHKKCHRVSFYLGDKQWTDLKIMCILTHRNASDFIRIAIQEKIKRVKEDTQIS